MGELSSIILKFIYEISYIYIVEVQNGEQNVLKLQQVKVLIHSCPFQSVFVTYFTYYFITAITASSI